jgi:formylglycine-generating enzyme required for sulfatase activity
MRWVPGGSFLMGSEDFYPEERPVRRVAVDGFWMDEKPVTASEFRRFVRETGYVTVAERPLDPAQYPDADPDLLVPGSLVFHATSGPVNLDDYRNWWDWVPGAQWRHPEGPGSTLHGRELHPVTHVAHEDAAAYAAWAGKALPTEVEWERAARGGLDGATYAWGDDAQPDGTPMANTWQGEFLYGNANEEDRRTFFGTTPLRRRSTAPYLIGRTEVTFADWLTYVESLPQAERASKLPSIEKVNGSIVVRPDRAGHWRIELQPEDSRYVAGWDQPITYQGRERHTSQDWRRFPVLGVKNEDTVAYAAWLDRTRRLPGARLCSEVEWERAARGADGRPYPGGLQLEPDDANLQITHNGKAGPDEVGTHLGSISPFGLFDMCGNAFELTVSERKGYVLRGGSYALDRKTAHLTNRGDFNVSSGDVTVGFRLCATPPLPR